MVFDRFEVIKVGGIFTFMPKFRLIIKFILYIDIYNACYAIFTIITNIDHLKFRTGTNSMFFVFTVYT